MNTVISVVFDANRKVKKILRQFSVRKQPWETQAQVPRNLWAGPALIRRRHKFDCGQIDA